MCLYVHACVCARSTHVCTCCHALLSRVLMPLSYPSSLLQGRPVLVYKLGAADLEAAKAVTSDQRMTQYHIKVSMFTHTHTWICTGRPLGNTHTHSHTHTHKYEHTMRALLLAMHIHTYMCPVKNGGMERPLANLLQEYERIMRAVLPACSVLAGRHVEQVVTVIDVGGLKMK